jgi:hypothetical protein
MLETQVRSSKKAHKRTKEVEDGEEGKKKFRQGNREVPIPVGSSSSDDDSEGEDASTKFVYRVSKANGSNDGSE